jgi:hypothetical protein
VPANADFVCDKVAVLGETIKETPCSFIKQHNTTYAEINSFY